MDSGEAFIRPSSDPGGLTIVYKKNNLGGDEEKHKISIKYNKDKSEFKYGGSRSKFNSLKGLIDDLITKENGPISNLWNPSDFAKENGFGLYDGLDDEKLTSDYVKPEA